MANYQRACDIKSLHPYLSAPIPAIKLKYLTAPTKPEFRRKDKQKALTIFALAIVIGGVFAALAFWL
jgi:hypothetical protein